MSLALQSSGGGSVTLQEPVTASNLTITVPAVTGTMAIQGPAFSAYPSSNQSVTSATFTKILFQTEVFDTNSNFASSTFTPTVAGYYQFNAYLSVATVVTRCLVNLYKNGTRVAVLSDTDGTSANTSGGSTLIYCNGSTDYIEIYGYVVGTSPQFYGASDSTYFSGCLVRGA